MCNDKLIQPCGHVRTNIDIVAEAILRYLNQGPREIGKDVYLEDLITNSGKREHYEQFVNCPHCLQALKNALTRAVSQVT